ncbi:MAG: galactokinase [Bifidobacteriaceae bacterium]|nr:galactokinase [Bifidobacteriaceae bacterium]
MSGQEVAGGPQFVEPWAEAEGIARVREAFRQTFGAEPAGVWAAPGRVNLIGEHTDYNGGIALPIALAHRTFVAANVAMDDAAHLASAQVASAQDTAPRICTFDLAAVAPGKVSGWGAYAVGVIWALRRCGFAVPALTGYVDSCVPFGAGLSSSAALEAVFALAAQDLRRHGPEAVQDGGPGTLAAQDLRRAQPGTAPDGGPGGALGADGGGPGPIDRASLADACVEAENLIAGAPTGGMDQAAVLRSRPGHALIVDSGTGQVQPVPFDLAEAGLELLVIDTRTEHVHAGGQYGSRRQTCIEAARTLGVSSLREVTPADLPAAMDRLGGPGTIPARRIRHVVTEIQRTEQFITALRAGQWAAIGPLMDASHASLRHDYEVSAAGLDLAVQAARAAGALGARMTGGGFGGSAIALVRAGETTPVATAVQAAFAVAGFGQPAFYRAWPSGPAQRVA